MKHSCGYHINLYDNQTCGKDAEWYCNVLNKWLCSYHSIRFGCKCKQ